MLAIYPAATWADDVAKLRLSGAYWRRKRLEARLMANEFARVLAGGRQQDRQRSTAELYASLGIILG